MIEAVEDDFYLFWKSLGSKPQTTLRCFERGEIITLHDSDAILVAKDYLKNLSMVKYFSKGQTNLSYITIKKSNSDFFRHFLLKRQYRIELYCTERKYGKDDWFLKLKASPGNLEEVEDILLGNSDVVETSGICGVNIKQTNDQIDVYLAFCHKESRKFYVGEFVDSVHLANLETALVQLEAKECLLPTGLFNFNSNDKQNGVSKIADNVVLENLNLIVERTGILPSEIKKSEFVDTDVVQDLNYLLRCPNPESTNISVLFEKELSAKGALSSLNAIIKFLNLKADETNAHCFSLEWFSLDNHVRLDSAATRALHLLPSSDDKNRFQSVYGVLNYCRTLQGQRLLGQWLKQPLTDQSKINERLDLVESLVEESSVRRGLHDDFLRRIPDLQRLIRRLVKRKGSGLQDVYQIYQTVLRLPNAMHLLNQCPHDKLIVVNELLVVPLEQAVNNFARFQQMVESTIDLECVSHRNEFIIRADFDGALEELKRKLDSVENRIKDEFKRCARKLGLEPSKSVKLDINDQWGYFMRVTLKEEKILRDFKSFQILDTQKAGVRFRNPAMSDLNETYGEVRQEYLDAQRGIVDEVLRITAGYMEPLNQLNNATALLDVIVSLATAAVSTSGMPYVRPTMLNSDDGRILLKEARHPCLEMQDSVCVIPNDVHLERGKQIFLTITGPNMGGKSTYIHSVGVIVAMAQIGSFVPCSHAELMPVDAIMARVGAADYQSRGISTFLAEMLETSSVLRSVTANSLVIIDELGRGTSTYDGFGLAWAVASHLAGPQVGCFSLFATHFHELTSLAHQMPHRVANLRVMANVLLDGKDKMLVDDRDGRGGSEEEEEESASTKVVMMYKVEPGICNRSYGLDVARLAGLPSSVIKDAEMKSEQDEQLESIWLQLESQQSKLDPDETQKSLATDLADDLRPQILCLLNSVLENEHDESTIGMKMADLTKEMLHNTSASSFSKNTLLGLALG